MSAPRMVHLTAADTEFEARVLVAKLGSAGILAEVRGLCAPYPVLARADVWVEADALPDARELITADLDDAFEVAPVDRVAADDAPRLVLRQVLVAVAVVILVGLAVSAWVR